MGGRGGWEGEGDGRERGMGGRRGGGEGEYGYFQGIHNIQVQIEANQSGKYNSYFLSSEAVRKCLGLNIYQLELIKPKKYNFSKIITPKLKARVAEFNPLLNTAIQ